MVLSLRVHLRLSISIPYKFLGACFYTIFDFKVINNPKNISKNFYYTKFKTLLKLSVFYHTKNILFIM